MASVTLKVDGLRELGEAFKLLSDDMQGKIGRATTNAMAQVVKKIAVRKAPIANEDYVVEGVPVKKGNLPKQIVVKRLKPSETDLTSEHIVAVRGKRKDGYASRIGSLQEFGTIKMPAHPFMRPALDEGKQAAIDAGKKRLVARIDKANRGGK